MEEMACRVFTGTKRVASYMWQSSKRGALVVLVLAVSPTLFPLALFVSFVGVISAVPFLCGAAAYYLVFRNAALQVQGTAHLLVSAKWDSQYEQRNEEGGWRPLNGTGDVFIAAALRSDVAGVSSNEGSESSCREAPAGRLVAFEDEAEVVEANPTFAKPSPAVTFGETNYPVQGRAHAELPLSMSFPSGEAQQVYSGSSVAIEGDQVLIPLREQTKSSCETCNDFPPDIKKLSVSTSVFSDYTWPSDSSEHEGFELPLTRGTEYEDLCVETASSTDRNEEENDLEPSAVTDSTLFVTPDEVTEDWVTRRKRWEEESTPGRLVPLSPTISSEARSVFNPLFESTPSLPLRKLNSGDKKNHICKSPSFRTRDLSKRHSAPRELHRTQTWSTSGSTLSPRQLTVQGCKSGLNALGNEQGSAYCEACAQSREGKPTSRAGASIRSSLRLPWR